VALFLMPVLTQRDTERIHDHSLDLAERVGIGGLYLDEYETRGFARLEHGPPWPPFEEDHAGGGLCACTEDSISPPSFALGPRCSGMYRGHCG
jgi:hypothetical protein